MAPKISETLELRFDIGKSQSLLVREVTPRTNSDFLVTQGGVKKDQGFLSQSSSGGIAEDQFYVGKSRVKDFQLGNNLFVQNSKDKRAVVVQLVDE